MPTYTKLAIDDADSLVFGHSPRPVTLRSGLIIGGGDVFPELNFTLPPMSISADTMPGIREQYEQMATAACQRAVELAAPGLVIEFEMLPEMTLNPEWGVSLVEVLRAVLEKYAALGLLTGLRVTPNDIREFARPPVMRGGELWDDMMRSFEGSSRAGADMLAIESTGGKELHDDALLNADIPAIALALGVLGPSDMRHLWSSIVEISAREGVIPSGDSACGFANTAMVLADQHHIPRVLAALIRVMSVPRSLVAFEVGAVGPNKDCAYEGPFTKAITGTPISLEGAEAACAHLSPIGNIAKATPDLWSNESVQNVRLLGATAPVVSLEQLTYAVRLMNTASHRGATAALALRDLFVESDAGLDPQAYVLRPDNVIALSSQIIQETTPYARTRRAGLATAELLRRAVKDGEITLGRPEARWLDRLSKQLDDLPEDEVDLIAQVAPTVNPAKVSLEQYGLAFAGA